MDHHDPPSDPASDDGHPVVASLLSLLAPGLGLIYAGRLLAGLVVNVGVVLLVLLFVIAGVVLQFFPLYPAMVIVAAWLVSCVFSSWRAVELIDTGNHSRSRAYQHPLIYLLIAVLTFLAPLAVTGHFTVRHLMTVVSVDDTSMLPGVHPGDRMIVDRTGFRDQPPQRGDVVAIRSPHSGDLVVMRIVAIPGDTIHMQGFTMVINDTLVHHDAADGIDVDDIEVWLEHNQQQRYLVSLVPGTSVDATLPESELGDDQYFALTDNRSYVDANEAAIDSRTIGSIDVDQIAGQPLSVLWSTSPESEAIHWERVGLPMP